MRVKVILVPLLEYHALRLIFDSLVLDNGLGPETDRREKKADRQPNEE
jgi:hypothetical protein